MEGLGGFQRHILDFTSDFTLTPLVLPKSKQSLQASGHSPVLAVSEILQLGIKLGVALGGRGTGMYP